MAPRAVGIVDSSPRRSRPAGAEVTVDNFGPYARLPTLVGQRGRSETHEPRLYEWATYGHGLEIGATPRRSGSGRESVGVEARLASLTPYGQCPPLVAIVR